MVKLPQFPKFKGFAGETKLHGIPRTVEGSWTSIAFWAILAIVCIGMAINDLIQMVKDYQSDAVAIHVSLQDNINYTWPTPTLCMEFVQHFNSNPHIRRANPFATDRYSSSSIETLIDNFILFYEGLDKVVNYTQITDTSFKSDSNLIYYPYVMLGYLLQLEQKLLGTTQQYLTDYQLNVATNDPQSSARIGRMYDHYRARNVTMGKLTKWIGMLQCLQAIAPPIDARLFNVAEHFENYRYFGDPEYIQLPFCRADLITQLGFGMVCTKLFEEPSVPVRDDYKYFTVYDGMLIDPSVSPTDQMNNPYGNVMQVASVVHNLQWHLDLQGRDMVPEDRSGIFSWNPAEYVVLDISVSSEYQFINRPSNPCSNAVETQYQCQWRKRLEFVQGQCGCWPTLADLSNPNVSEADSCNRLVTSGIATIAPSQFCPSLDLSQLDTTSDCPDDCHITNFKLTRQQPSRMLDPNMATNNVFRGQLEFRFISDQSQLVADQPVYDWNNFMGQWGGSIGTWLGN